MPTWYKEEPYLPRESWFLECRNKSKCEPSVLVAFKTGFECSDDFEDCTGNRRLSSTWVRVQEGESDETCREAGTSEVDKSSEKQKVLEVRS